MCGKEVMLNVELFVRHGCYLELRDTCWYVAMGDVSEPPLGRPTLEALGIKTKELLAAAVDRMGSSVDIGVLVPRQNFPEGKLARILNQGLLYQEKAVMSESFDDEDESWLDLGQDKKAKMDEAISKAVLSAAQNGISTKGLSKMQYMLYEYLDVLRFRLGNDPPAKEEPWLLK